MLNLIERTVRYRLTKIIVQQFLNIFTHWNLTWTLIRVHKTGPHRIRSSSPIRFKLIIRGNSLRKFFLGLNRSTKQDRNTRGVTATTEDLVVGEFSPVNVVPYFGLADEWFPIDHGPWLSVCVVFDFLIYFSRFECMFQKFISQARSV